MSTTTMVAGWPDAIKCTSSTRGESVLYLGVAPFTDGNFYYYEPLASSASNVYIGFSPSGAYFSTLGTGTLSNCNVSIQALAAQGRAFNFIGGGASSNALGDRITSGTSAVTVNSATSYISLTTGGVDWGYLNSGLSYLPRLNANQISSTLISTTYLQIQSATTVLACDGSLAGSMRYTSGTMQVCNGSSWGNIGLGVQTGTIAAFANASCPNGWTEYTPSRGRLLRGIDNGAGIDPSGTRAAGGLQTDALQGHFHTIYSGQLDRFGGNGGSSNWPVNWLDGNNVSRGDNAKNVVTDGVNGTPRIASETRPANVAVTYCMYSGYQSQLETGVATLASLSDVSVAGATTGQSLVYNGSAWVASTTIGTGSSNALGDRISSGTVSVTVNPNGYVSLTTTGTTWGYFGTSASYLPQLNAANVSASYVSSTITQVSGTSLACSTALKGSIRYSNLSNTLGYCNSTAWVSAGPSATVVPAFRAYKNGSDQTVTAGTNTKVTLQTEVFDTNNNFASDRFTPTIPGMYLVTGQVACNSATGCVAMLYKNGTLYQQQNAIGSGDYATITVITDMNGTTDYLEMWGVVVGSTTIYQGTQTSFSGALLTMNSGGSAGAATPAGISGSIQFNSAGALAGRSDIIVDPSGSVGIGTGAPRAALDVSGTVKMAGTGAEACVSNTLGTFRFNPINGVPQICR